MRGGHGPLEPVVSGHRRWGGSGGCGWQVGASWEQGGGRWPVPHLTMACSRHRGARLVVVRRGGVRHSSPVRLRPGVRLRPAR